MSQRDVTALTRSKTASYTLLDGTTHEVEYDPDAPCWMCGQPVVEASMGGTVVCPWCDCGMTRDGRRWTLAECFDAHRRFNDSRLAASAGAKREEGLA